MVKQHPLKGRKSKMWRNIGTQNDWGSANGEIFRPEREDLPIRCFQCSNLMEASFTSEAECPNCHWRFRPSEARDMYVEAVIVGLRGGWSKELLDNFSPYDYPVRQTPKGDIERIEDVERTMAAWATNAERKNTGIQNLLEKVDPETYRAQQQAMRAKLMKEEQRKAEKALIQQLRQQNPLSNLKHPLEE